MILPASPESRRLCVCYVPALDVRELAAGACPYAARLLDAYPSVRFRTQPATDQLATILTGTWPHQHGLWGPRLKAEWRARTPLQQSFDRLPDVVCTTAQGIAHLVNGPIDLATMPPRRRRRFDWLRFNVKHARDVGKVVRPINGLASVFTVVGADRSRFVYQDNFWDLDRLLAGAGNGDHVLEMVDCHCLDHLQHWMMSRPDAIRSFYRGVDGFVAALHEKCERAGIRFVLLSDHGMEPNHRVVDLMAALRHADLSADAYDVFVESTRATLWFHTAPARTRITDLLGSRADGILLEFEEMAAYDLHFADRGYGDAYFYARPGHTFFPNDFHQPIASAVIALSDRQQRLRLRTPWHQADHGYLPDHDCEVGFMLVADDRARASDAKVTLVDIAPTLLGLLGRPGAETMTGRAIFRPG